MFRHHKCSTLFPIMMKLHISSVASPHVARESSFFIGTSVCTENRDQYSANGSAAAAAFLLSRAFQVMVAFSSLQVFWGEVWCFIPCLRFFFWSGNQLTHAHQFHCLSQDQSTEAHRAEMNVAKCSLMSSVWALYPNSPDSIVSSPWLPWVKNVCMFRCNLPFALLVEWVGSFTCRCGNTGLEQTLSKSQHRKSTLEKEILQLLLLGLKLATFQSWVLCSTHKLSPLFR